MAFDNATNRGRITKILDTLSLVEKSARSNEASQEELDDMLAPLHNHLGYEKPQAEPEAQVKEPRRRTGASAPPWASVLDMAREASLKDLTGAMAVYLNRIDEEINDGNS